MNIHELTKRVYGVEHPTHGEEYQIHRLLLKSSRVTGYRAPGSGAGHIAEVDETTARFVHLLYLLREDSAPYGRPSRMTTDDLVTALEQANALGAPSGHMLVLEFRGGLHSAVIVDDAMLPGVLGSGTVHAATAWRIVRIP